MFKLPNPYVLGVGALICASTFGSMYYQSARIHHFHTMYDQSQVIIGQRDEKIKEMTSAQNEQLARSNSNVIKVVQGPREVQSIIREVRAAPSSKDCKAPTYSEEVKNAF